MIRSILLAGAALLSVSISPLNAEASGAPWCAVNRVGRWRCALGLQVSLDRRMPAGDRRQSWLLQSEPVLCSQPPRTQELAAGLADGFKDHCKI